jgi:DNA-binding response OmpR family regulator
MPVSAQSCSSLEVTPSFPAGPAPAPVAENTPALPPKILILDDDPDLLEAYSRILLRLPCQPEVRIASCATRAMSLLDAEPFTLLISDLRMPRIDGFQVLLSARRRFPELKTVAMTSMTDQQYRARAYSSGIDFYTEKPSTPSEIRLFSACIDALLARDSNGAGFRGIQSKSLMDLLQIECLSQASVVLRISRGSLEGRIWVEGGAIIDAEVQDLTGEEAFKTIFSWKTGHFEHLPGEPNHPRAIFVTYESLLLDSAQTADEAAASFSDDRPDVPPAMSRDLMILSGVRGVESLLLINPGGHHQCWGIESPELSAKWTEQCLEDFQALGEALNAGPLQSIEAAGQVRGVVLLSQGGRKLMAGTHRKLGPRLIRIAGKELATHLCQE